MKSKGRKSTSRAKRRMSKRMGFRRMNLPILEMLPSKRNPRHRKHSTRIAARRRICAQKNSKRRFAPNFGGTHNCFLRSDAFARETASIVPMKLRGVGGANPRPPRRDFEYFRRRNREAGVGRFL